MEEQRNGAQNNAEGSVDGRPPFGAVVDTNMNAAAGTLRRMYSGTPDDREAHLVAFSLLMVGLGGSAEFPDVTIESIAQGLYRYAAENGVPVAEEWRKIILEGAQPMEVMPTVDEGEGE